MVDWALAQQLAAVVAGEPEEAPLTEDFAALARRSEELVSGYTGLTALGRPLPEGEAIGRREWTKANLASMRGILDPVTERVGEGAGLLRGPMRAAGGLLVAAEVGVIVGYLGQRVLGQYDVALLDVDAPARLLFVAPNLSETSRTLDLDREELVTWVALHEVTHALQFAGVPWLREHMAGLLRELLDSIQVSIDPSRVLRLPGQEDLRALAEAVRQGDLISLVASPQQKAILDRMQAVMALLEGYAEHVMDATGRELLPSLDKLRAALDRRRTTPRSPLAELLQRLIGLDLKLRQYVLGKQFCDAVVAAHGIAGLNRAWSAPEALPTLEELDAPEEWAARTQVRIVTK